MSIDPSRSRRTLPSPMVDRSSYSIFSVIKQAIGKDLTRFSIPVVWNEPLSFLQRLAECLEYTSLLDRAASTDSPVERFHLINAFIVSSLAAHLERMSKPFNPLLGETFELKLDEPSTTFHYVSEQVSHHPPISAFFVRGNQWTLTANVEPKVKFQGTNVVATSDNRWILRFKRQGNLSRSSSQASFHSCQDEEHEEESDDEYVWSTPTVVIHNILFGRLWAEYQGEVAVKHVQSTKHSLLTIKTHSWFASQATRDAETFKYSGSIFDGPISTPIGAFHGNYGHCYYAIDDLNDVPTANNGICSAGGKNCIRLNGNDFVRSPPCDLPLTRSSRLIWHRTFPTLSDDESAARHLFYFFTPFAMLLNDTNVDPNVSLPATDARFRQDIRYLENGDLDAAAAEKHRLEEQQRAEARARLNEFEPLWFKKSPDGFFHYTDEYEQRKFDRCPNLFSQASFL